ncbi:MAG: hypothetical protein IKW81_03725, partial [Pseudobutyrivibrio sp.]|nr:hypothetical protein [Pseudobutyrivibrio sp.]
MSKLIRLTSENMNQLSSSDVCLISYAENYLDDMQAELGQGFIEKINYYVDIANKGGDKNYKDKMIKRLSLSDVASLDDTTNLVIVDDYYREVLEQFQNATKINRNIYLYANKETAYDLDYRAQYENQP